MSRKPVQIRTKYMDIVKQAKQDRLIAPMAAKTVPAKIRDLVKPPAIRVRKVVKPKPKAPPRFDPELKGPRKRCGQCGMMKYLTQFHRRKRGSDERSSRCAGCAANAQRLVRQRKKSVNQ